MDTVVNTAINLDYSVGLEISKSCQFCEATTRNHFRTTFSVEWHRDRGLGRSARLALSRESGERSGGGELRSKRGVTSKLS